MSRVNGHAPDQRQQEIQGAPAPVRVQIDTGEVSGPDGVAKFVLLTLQSTNGTFHFFLDPAHAKAISTDLEKAARLSVSGLVLPGDGVPLPPESRT